MGSFGVRLLLYLSLRCSMACYVALVTFAFLRSYVFHSYLLRAFTFCLSFVGLLAAALRFWLVVRPRGPQVRVTL